MTALSAGAPIVGTRLRTPRAAAVAGIIFSILLTLSLLLLRLSIPTDPLVVGDWLKTGSKRVSLALNLVPFAGVAFMWLLGVLRDRLGVREDKFFATVFLGSGVLFLGMLFVAAATVGGLVLAYSTAPADQLSRPSFAFARVLSFELMHIYTFKMAAVFMIATSTLIIHIRFAPRWIAIFMSPRYPFSWQATTSTGSCSSFQLGYWP
jgi:hypothetical protein